MKEVLVLLSTFNGSLYIKEQIESIFNQKGVSVNILVRDDGSTDSTCDIINNFIDKGYNIKLVKGNNVGFKKSFCELINIADKDYPNFDFYCYSDQDDVWYSNKISTSCEVLDRFNNDKPNVVTCNSNLIDAVGNHIGIYRSFDPKYTNYTALFSTDFQGCSMTFNRKALNIYNIFPPENECHDQWMFVICILLGNVCHINTPLFGYRIHGRNAIGISNRKRSLISIFLLHIKYWTFSQHPHKRKVVNVLFDRWQNLMAPDIKDIAFCYLNYRRNFFCKLKLFVNRKCFKKSDGKYYPFSFWRSLIFNKF